MMNKGLMEDLQRVAHFLDVQGRPEMAHTCREAAEQMHGLAEQIGIMKREAHRMAEAIDKTLDVLDAVWCDPGVFGEDEQ